MSNKNATRDDVARLAKVSPGTVSNVVNNKDIVNESTKKKVLDAIQKLDYTPNNIARSLNSKSTKHIGLVTDDILNPHFSQFVKGAQLQALEEGYILSIALASYNIDNIINDFISRQVDAIIYNVYSKSLSEDNLRQLERNGIYLISRQNFERKNSYYISIDYKKGLKKAYKYLYDMGHRKISYIDGLKPIDSSALFLKRRALGFVESSNKLTGGFDERYIVYGKKPYLTDHFSGYAYTKELLSRQIDFTALIIANDFMSIGAINAFEENNIKVPEDISLISFDNTILADTFDFTSIYTDTTEIGKYSVKLIIDSNLRENNSRVYDMNIYERNSVKKITS